jgi:hypothetical protein
MSTAVLSLLFLLLTEEIIKCFASCFIALYFILIEFSGTDRKYQLASLREITTKERISPSKHHKFVFAFCKFFLRKKDKTLLCSPQPNVS